MKYYTYAYLREDGTPYYIGKGTGRRIDNPNHYSGLPPKNKRVFLKQNLTEEEAFKHEKYMIVIFGRKDLGTGILRNLTDGGDGKSGWKMSEGTKKKIRESNTGKRHTDESKKKMSKSAKNRTSIHGMLGKTHTKEVREKLSKLYKGRQFPGNPYTGNPYSQKGTTWWNNGQITKRSVECPGKQFVPGRIPLGPYKRR